MLKSIDVANYFLSQCSEESGDLISNLKMQKLVYYAQGFHLAVYDTPLFQEEIQAWLHGPVIPVLYSHYKPYGSAAIPLPSEVDFDNYDANTRDLLDDVYNVYGQYSAWKLRDLTHQEPPWVDAAKAGLNSVISHSSLQEYFKTQLTE